MMAALEIDVPVELRDYVERRVREDGFKDVSEFVCTLIATDQRETARSVLEAELLRGLDSGPPIEMTPAEWDELRREVQARVTTQAQ